MLRAGAGRRTAVRWTVVWAVCVLVVVISGVTRSNPAVALSTAGHWVYNHTVRAVFHVDGASKSVDAEVPTPHLSPAEQVVEDRKHGYVVDGEKGRVTVFGKSSLKVDSTLTTGSTEQPVVLQTSDQPYLVYRNAGNIVRLGDHQTVVHTGSALASPVGTSDGAVWVQRADGSICRLGSSASVLTCVGKVAAGHHTQLVTVDDDPAVVDTTAGTIAKVTNTGIGAPLKEGSDIPVGSQIATTDAGGRLPLITPAAANGGSSLVLVDTSTLGTTSPPAPRVVVPLGTDQFDAPLSAGASVVLVDRTRRTVYTYDTEGRLATKLAAPTGDASLIASRGEDGRVYIDNGDGTDTLVVDGNGAISSVADKRPAPISPLGGRGLPELTSAPGATPKRSATSSTAPTSPASTSTSSSTPPTSSPTAAGIPTTTPTGAALAVDITPHSNDHIDVTWTNAGTGVHYVVVAEPSGTIVCRSVVHSCGAVGLPTGHRTTMRVYATLPTGAVRAGTSPDSVIPWHWATAPTASRALAGRNYVIASWQNPKDLKSGVLIGWDVQIDGGHDRKVTSRHITIRGLKRHTQYRINVSAITQDPNGSAVTISGDQSTNFVKTD